MMKWTLAILALSSQPVSCFVVRRPSGQKNQPLTQMMAKDNKEELDLFEYFDPLLSPHAYPNGISSEEDPLEQEKQRIRIESAPPLRGFGFQTPLKEEQEKQKQQPPLEEEETPTPPTPKETAPALEIDTPTPPPPKETPTPLDVVTTAQDDEASTDRLTVDPKFTFDPTLSPHTYAHGTPDVVVGDDETVYSSAPKPHKLGILLVDHGSRNQESNERLHKVAEIYQGSLSSRQAGVQVVVRAAHMEIATPSIPDVVQALVEDDGVDEIVCHPFFLSPAGRHAKEDVPRILAGTVETMNLEIPVATTDPTGANIDAMITVIHSMVSQTATVPITRK